MTDSQKKMIIILTSVLLGVLFLWWVIDLLIPKSYISLQTAPEQVYVKINDETEQQINNGDRLTIKPGEYRVIIYRDEFNPQIENFELKNGETKEIVAALYPLTEAARQLLQNEGSGQVLEKATAVRMDREVEILNEKYPILKELPLSNMYYKITSCESKKYPNDSLVIALCISVADGFRGLVSEDLKQLGYNLNDYEVIWRVEG